MKILIITFVILLVLAASLAVILINDPYEGEAMDTEVGNLTATGIPPIDADAPDNVETATFALG